MDYFLRTAVQKGLNEKTQVAPPLVIDGVWGAATTAALKKYQQMNGIGQTGQYDATTQQKLGTFLAQKYLSLTSVQAAAAGLGVDMASMVAVAIVESRGAGFLPNGQCKILFERHKMYAQYKAKYGQVKADAMAAKYPNIINPIKGGYLGDAAEYTRLNQAITLDRDCAYLSASWGVFQIMGFNYAACGYTNVVAYVQAMQVSETAHLNAFALLLKNYLNGVILTNIKLKNWSKVAEFYNGTADIATYSKDLSSAFTNTKSYLS